MRGTFGITGRLVMIGMVGFLAVATLFGLLLYQMRVQEDALERAFPLPKQLAAIVTTADALPADNREIFLRAFNSQTVSVAISPDIPAEGAGTERKPLVEERLKFADPLGSRDVRVFAEAGISPMIKPSNWVEGVPLMVTVQLEDGDYLVVQTRGLLLGRFVGVPTGFWLAILSLIIAIFTLVALVRETRPLRDLTAALRRFGEHATPEHVRPAGASDVRSLIEAVNRMQDRISTMMKGRTILAGAISHDLKTYLTRLQMRIEDIPDDAERAAAERDIASMLAVVENALSFAKSGAGTRQRDRVDLGDLARAEAQRLSTSERPVTMRISDDLPVLADPIAMRRVVANLVENARRYATTILVTARREGETVRLTVEDDGPGIPEAEREAVFEPFYRLDPARNTQSGGSGLGLALCRQIVETHDGSITISAADMGGACVEVRLPLAAG